MLRQVPVFAKNYALAEIGAMSECRQFLNVRTLANTSFRLPLSSFSLFENYPNNGDLVLIDSRTFRAERYYVPYYPDRK